MQFEEKTRQMMIKDGRLPEDLAYKTGLKQRWLYLFRTGKQQDYGVRKVQRLYNYLNRSK